jgi:putative mRNA 3-end processing factor
LVLRRLSVKAADGILVEYGNMKLLLDPVRSCGEGLVFVSHAHHDHLLESGEQRVLASKETAALAAARGKVIQNLVSDVDGLRMMNSGHIFGSRSLLIDDEIYYTGDFSLRSRAFLKGGETPRCRVLIIESTYGKEVFTFPPIEEVVDRTHKIISEQFSMGRPVILMGYPLGKAQILTRIFSVWKPFYQHGAVAKINSTCSSLGLDLGGDHLTYQEAQRRGLLEKKPWVLITPMYSGRSTFISNLKKKYGAVTVAFSGWAADPSFKYAMGVDYAIPLSDHCDFNELKEVVKRCFPEVVYTFHGFAAEFAEHLRREGFDARPLTSMQETVGAYADE